MDSAKFISQFYQRGSPKTLKHDYSQLNDTTLRVYYHNHEKQKGILYFTTVGVSIYFNNNSFLVCFSKTSSTFYYPTISPGEPKADLKLVIFMMS